MKPFFSHKGVGESCITLIENDKIITEDLEVVQTLNDFFTNAVVSLNIDIPSETIIDAPDISDPIEAIILKYSKHPSILNIKENVTKASFSFMKIDEACIEEELKALDATKACISGSIPAKILKENSVIIKTPLTSVINNGISNGIFEDKLKVADLVPLRKEKESTIKKNYRNISLLPVVSKIFEEVMQKQMGGYMDNFLSQFLCGYRKGYNAQYALLSMLEKWKGCFRQGRVWGAQCLWISQKHLIL